MNDSLAVPVAVPPAAVAADAIPEWHETDYRPSDVVNLKQIERLNHAPEYAALRSYATGRREHWVYGPMPDPVVRISNRRLWLRSDVVEWLTCPLPVWKRNKQDVKRWIAAGRPRTLELAGTTRGDSGATLLVDHGRSPTAP